MKREEIRRVPWQGSHSTVVPFSLVRVQKVSWRMRSLFAWVSPYAGVGVFVDWASIEKKIEERCLVVCAGRFLAL
jgi:hypothetical protein